MIGCCSLQWSKNQIAVQIKAYENSQSCYCIFNQVKNSRKSLFSTKFLNEFQFNDSSQNFLLPNVYSIRLKIYLVQALQRCIKNDIFQDWTSRFTSVIPACGKYRSISKANVHICLIYLFVGTMESYNKIRGCAQLYFTVIIPYPEFEICIMFYEHPESIVCIYVWASQRTV